MFGQPEVNFVVPIVLLGLPHVTPTNNPGSPRKCLEMSSKQQLESDSIKIPKLKEYFAASGCPGYFFQYKSVVVHGFLRNGYGTTSENPSAFEGTARGRYYERLLD